MLGVLPHQLDRGYATYCSRSPRSRRPAAAEWSNWCRFMLDRWSIGGGASAGGIQFIALGGESGAGRI